MIKAYNMIIEILIDKMIQLRSLYTFGSIYCLLLLSVSFLGLFYENYAI